MFYQAIGRLVLATAFGIAIGALGHQAIGSDKPKIARTELMNIDLSDMPGKIAHMYTMELAPGLMTPRHSHPGHYLVYVLEGTGIVEQDDRPTLHLSPGVSYYIHSPFLTPDSWHSVWNTSKTQTLKTLVVLINDKGQPGTVFDK
jgi:quercetin dioxygenase-like cupin family protein